MADTKKLSLDSTIKELLANDTVKKELEKLVPGITTNPVVALAKNSTVNEIAKKIPQLLTSDKLAQIEKILKTVSGK